MIDTKRWHAIQLPMRIEDQRALLEDFFSLEADHTPLSREELETVLKEEGWKWMKVKKHFKRGSDELWFSHDESALLKNGFDFCIPLSAVTRATLRSCGVIK